MRVFDTDEALFVGEFGDSKKSLAEIRSLAEAYGFRDYGAGGINGHDSLKQQLKEGEAGKAMEGKSLEERSEFLESLAHVLNEPEPVSRERQREILRLAADERAKRLKWLRTMVRGSKLILEHMRTYGVDDFAGNVEYWEKELAQAVDMVEELYSGKASD